MDRDWNKSVLQVFLRKLSVDEVIDLTISTFDIITKDDDEG